MNRPAIIRAVLYQYWFSTPAQKRTQEASGGLANSSGTYAPTLTRTSEGKFAAIAVPTLNGPPQ